VSGAWGLPEQEPETVQVVVDLVRRAAERLTELGAQGMTEV
jgi:hypothetical protein